MRFIIVGIIVIILASCGPSKPTSDISAQSAFETYVAALNQGDVVKAASYYDTADGFHWIERGHVQYETGAEAGKALMALQSGGGQSEMTLDNIRVAELTQNSALISSHFDFVMTSESGELQFAFDGWMTVGMVKREDGWKIAGGQTGPGLSD